MLGSRHICRRQRGRHKHKWNGNTKPPKWLYIKKLGSTRDLQSAVNGTTDWNSRLVVKPQFHSRDPDVQTKTDQVILLSGLPSLSIDLTISNVCSDQRLKSMKGKPKYLAVASLREQSKINDYIGECRMIGHDFLPVAFECQGSIGQMFAQHFENCVQKRAEELGMKSLGPLRWYWRQRLSIALQRHITCLRSQACNERMYAMQMHRHKD